MFTLTKEQRKKITGALLEQRSNFGGTDAAFAKQFDINGSVFSRIKNGDEMEGLLRDAQWMNIARELDLPLTERKWNTAKTSVFKIIQEDILFCKQYAKGRICVDDCGIGKTYTARYLSRTLQNCFYVDASQGKSKQQFIRLLARAIGVDATDKFVKVKANIKYSLKMLSQPIVIIDEAGDLEYTAFLELKELWNATPDACGWYLMGADGLRAKIERGISNKKVGYAELFSRYSESYTTCVPREKGERLAFYRKLITDVLSVNMDDKSKLQDIVRRCLQNDSGNIGGLRRAESLLILNA